jgi:small-conductance mechanosensitive channel
MKVLNDLIAQLEGYYDVFIVFFPKIIIGILFSFLVYWVLKIFKKRILKYLDTNTEDKLLINFLDGVMDIGLILFTIFVFLYSIGQSGLASGILGAATFTSIVIGFAFKDIIENFLAGVIMAFNRPFRIGDYVMMGSVEGSIVEMSLRDTHLKTADGKDVYVPNGQIIKNPLYNYTIDGFLRGNFTVGVSYDADIESVRKIILEIVKSIPGVLNEEKLPRTHVKSLGTNAVDIEIHYWINTLDKRYSGLEIKSLAQIQVIEALNKAEVDMPANIVELKNYSK